MNLAAVNRTIQALCSEVRSLGGDKREWRLLTEEELLYEATVCVFGSQMIYEVAVAAADRARAAGFLNCETIAGMHPDYEPRLVAVLTAPLHVEVGGVCRLMRPRFKNRLAVLLASTVRRIYDRGSSLQEILSSATSARHARALLVEAVSGFGPKQASLFLRRVGYCSELAVLDTHILDYLRMAHGIDQKPSSISRLTCYERVEAQFQCIAREFGHAIGCVDLAMWVTMRVAKREVAL